MPMFRLMHSTAGKGTVFLRQCLKQSHKVELSNPSLSQQFRALATTGGGPSGDGITSCEVGLDFHGIDAMYIDGTYKGNMPAHLASKISLADFQKLVWGVEYVQHDPFFSIREDYLRIKETVGSTDSASATIQE
jgi:hypothetical protein